MQSILERRSIRKYENAPIDKEHINALLKAAMAAPSAGNEQPWHFVVIEDKEILNTIPTFHPHAQMLKQAPLAIVVSGDLSLEKCKGYWVQDCAAATENILIASQELGLGSVWVGVYPIDDRTKRLQELLNIPKDIIPFSLVSLGHPDEEKPSTDRFDEGRIHYNKW